LTIYCVGCGNVIPWDGKGLFAYTCRCGATLLMDEKGNLIMPASLVLAIAEGRTPAHIDYYVGKSSYTNKVKDKAIEMLKRLGAIWSWECPECRDKVVERTALEVKERLYPFELHPELKKLVMERVK